MKDSPYFIDAKVKVYIREKREESIVTYGRVVDAREVNGIWRPRLVYEDLSALKVSDFAFVHDLNEVDFTTLGFKRHGLERAAYLLSLEELIEDSKNHQRRPVGRPKDKRRLPGAGGFAERTVPRSKGGGMFL